MRTWTAIAGGLSLRSLWMTIIMVAIIAPLSAQSTDWDKEDPDADEEEPTEEKALIDDRPAKKEDVTITLDEKAFHWAEEVHIKKGDTIDISVRDLAPSSRVEIVAEKGGIPLSRKVFYSNNKGELDLEIRVGSRKVKGKATLIYTPSGAVKKEREVMIIVE